jgi:hypothetical protein
LITLHIFFCILLLRFSLMFPELVWNILGTLWAYELGEVMPRCSGEAFTSTVIKGQFSIDARQHILYHYIIPLALQFFIRTFAVDQFPHIYVAGVQLDNIAAHATIIFQRKSSVLSVCKCFTLQLISVCMCAPHLPLRLWCELTCIG